MGQSSSTNKPKRVPPSTWRPETLLTETIGLSDNETPHLRKRRASETKIHRSGPKKKDVNKAIVFLQDFLPLYAIHNEASVSMSTPPLISVANHIVSSDGSQIDIKIREELKAISSRGMTYAGIAKDLSKNQPGNLYKKFSFANQKDELSQQSGRFFQVDSFSRNQSTPDISKCAADAANDQSKGLAKNPQSPRLTKNPVTTPRSPTKLTSENEIPQMGPSSPSKAIMKNQLIPNYENQQLNESHSIEHTKKQSVSFRVESKDQSKNSEDESGFHLLSQNNKKQALINIQRNTVTLHDASKTKYEFQDNMQAQGSFTERTKYGDSNIHQNNYSYVPPQSPENSIRYRTDSLSPLQANELGTKQRAERRNFQAEPDYVDQNKNKKELIKSKLASQNANNKKWPSSSPNADRKEKKYKENVQTDKLKPQIKTASEKIIHKLNSVNESSNVNKKKQVEPNSYQDSYQRKKEPLRPSNLIHQNIQVQKKVEKSPMSRQGLKQSQTNIKYENDAIDKSQHSLHQDKSLRHGEEISQTFEKSLYPHGQRLSYNNHVRNSVSRPQFTNDADLNPINVDLNLDELLRVADRNASYSHAPTNPTNYLSHHMVGVNQNHAMPFQQRFQEPQNIDTQYISPKQLDETGYYEENSQYERKNNSLYFSRHEISHDEMNDHSIDRNNLSNSHIRRNKQTNLIQSQSHSYNFNQNS